MELETHVICTTPIGMLPIIVVSCLIVLVFSAFVGSQFHEGIGAGEAIVLGVLSVAFMVGVALTLMWIGSALGLEPECHIFDGPPPAIDFGRTFER